MKKWEYLTVMLTNEIKDERTISVQDKLNKLGSEGWELTIGAPVPQPSSSKMITAGGGPPPIQIALHAVFKRPVE